jgi:DNA-directed RNA polymerase subunit E'/Rpb7
MNDMMNTGEKITIQRRGRDKREAMEDRTQKRTKKGEIQPLPSAPSKNDIYTKSILTTKIILSIKEIGSNLKEILEHKLRKKVSGKCISSGYIRPNTINIVKYSIGVITMTEYVEFHIVYDCEVCFPVEGMVVSVFVKHITKAGLHCTLLREEENSTEENNNPLVVFIIKEHNMENEAFNEISIHDEIQVKIVGIRFELNDTFISAIGILVVDSGVEEKKGEA